MEELFEKEGRSIFSFNAGDLIIKIKPTEIKRKHYNENLGIETFVTERIDTSYISNPVIFKGIANNRLYVKVTTGALKDSVMHSSIFTHSADWALFELPDGVKMEEIV